MKNIYFLFVTLLVCQISSAKNMDLVVTDPIMPALLDIPICDDSNQDGYSVFDLTVQDAIILAAQSGVASDYSISYYETSTDATIGTNPINTTNSYYNFTPGSQTIYVRIRNVNTSQDAFGQFQIIVNTLPIMVQPLPPYRVCDNDADGLAAFDLANPMLALAILGSAQLTVNFTVSYYLTASGANPLTNVGETALPANYTSVTPNTQNVYIRVVNNGSGCANATGILTLAVEEQASATGPQTFADCDNYGSPNDGISILDLTQFAPSILNGQNPAVFIVSYYTNLADAIVGVNALTLAQAQMYETNPSVDTIWVKVENSNNSLTPFCNAITTINIAIATQPLVSTPTNLSVCDDDANPNDQYHSFNLTVRDTEITQNAVGSTVTYYPSLNDAVNNTNPITTPTNYINVQPAVQTLGVRVMDSSPLACTSITTLDIRVFPIPTPNTNPPPLAAQCDNNNSGDMLEVFDLTVNEAYIINGDPTLTFHYFHTMLDAISNTTEILTPTSAVVGSNVWIRVENNRVDYLGENCYVLVEQPLVVYPLPNPELISNNTLNTIYVDGSNNVVQPLQLDSQLSGNYSYQWQLNGAPIPNAYASTYLVNTALPGGGDSVFQVLVQDLDTSCTSSDSIIVSQSSGVPSPLGATSQTFNPGQTLAYLTVSGSNIQWYALATNKNVTSAPLSLSTVLVDGTTYYATQTVGGVESVARLPVTVHTALGLPSNELLSLQYAPNPVKDVMKLDSNTILKSIAVYNLLGQKLYEQYFNDAHVLIDLSNLQLGNYLLKVQGETAQKVIKIVKR